MNRYWIETRRLAACAAITLAFGCAGESQPKEAAQQKVSTYYDLGVDYLRNGNPAMAVRELQAALAIDPDHARIHHALAEAYRVTGRFPEAEAHLQRAVQLEPSYQGARLSLSALYIQMDRYEEAIRESQLLVADPTFPGPWRALTNVGWAQFKLGRDGEARKSLEEALTMRPGYWPALLNLGILDSKEGRRQEALENFTRVLESKPGASAEAETNYRLAEIYVSMGDRTRALEHLAVVIENQPTSDWGRRSREYRNLLQ
jgi:type IV pilus biogenesis/stability protein PilW